MDKTIGPYKILQVLHSGSRPLYRGEDATGQPVAIKTVPMAGLSEEDRERFAREAASCRSMEHPNVIRVYETGEADGVLYQAMELLEGADLDKVMASGRRLSWEEKLSIMDQVCAGLGYAHERRMVHRDIKPANLFLEDSGEVKVLDFGMVHLADSTLTRVGTAMGTLNYMAPEQIKGEACIPASDVFSAGVVFFQLASGIHPFSKNNQTLSQLVSAILFNPTPRLLDNCADAPEGLDFILDRALQKDPALRHQNGAELSHELQLCRSIRAEAATAAGSVSGSLPSVFPSDGKTVVIRRPARPKPAESQPAAAPPPPPRPPDPEPVPAQPVNYCPACAQVLPKGAEVCACGYSRPSVPNRDNTRTDPVLLYGLLAIVCLLAITLVIITFYK